MSLLTLNESISVFGMNIDALQHRDQLRMAELVLEAEILIIKKTVDPLKTHRRQLYQAHES